MLASLSGRPAIVIDEADQVAAGACVQAAAVLTGGTPAEVAAAWGRGTGHAVEPDHKVDADSIRAAYRAAAAAS